MFWKLCIKIQLRTLIQKKKHKYGIKNKENQIGTEYENDTFDPSYKLTKNINPQKLEIKT